ncbi:hypothetical protein [Coralliovum pocilloporae]|uniref:hypothetical protein n=1 Tax=Coralliovum pocilloporae TaxID=3066369 RepID=UPI0033075CD9
MSLSLDRVLNDLPENLSDIWGNETVRFSHALQDTGLFSDTALADLIGHHPDDLLYVSTMDNQGHDIRSWHVGRLGSARGEGIIEAVSKGPIWVNARNVNETDPRFKQIEETLFSQLEDAVPGLKTFKRRLGILLSSPKTRVFYHMDVPGQGLIQLRGSKRVYVYPPEAPFLSRESLEDVVLNVTEEEIPYDPAFDNYAEVFDIEPGDMLTWRLNGPHRIDNHDCLNVSMTVEYWTDDIRRSYAVNYANAVLRHFVGVKAKSTALSGPGFWAKAGLAAAVKYSGLAQRKQHKLMVDFEVDPASPTGMVPIQPQEAA